MTVASCASSTSATPAALAEIGHESYSCDIKPVANRMSDKEFELSISIHQQGPGGCYASLDAIADAEAARLCGPASRSVSAGVGDVAIVTQDGRNLQSFIKGELTYAIQCGNGA
jgi:hypothetical protein